MKYKVSTVFSLICLLYACASTTENQTNGVQVSNGCFEYVVPDTGNLMTLCLNGVVATMDIYYPNTGTGSPPTTCRLTGASTSEDGELRVTLNQGSCENGRAVAGSSYLCRLIGSEGLDCPHPSGLLLTFRNSDDS